MEIREREGGRERDGEERQKEREREIEKRDKEKDITGSQ